VKAAAVTECQPSAEFIFQGLVLTVINCMAGKGKDSQGQARQGKAWKGKARPGQARQG